LCFTSANPINYANIWKNSPNSQDHKNRKKIEKKKKKNQSKLFLKINSFLRIEKIVPFLNEKRN